MLHMKDILAKLGNHGPMKAHFLQKFVVLQFWSQLWSLRQKKSIARDQQSVVLITGVWKSILNSEKQEMYVLVRAT